MHGPIIWGKLLSKTGDIFHMSPFWEIEAVLPIEGSHACIEAPLHHFGMCNFNLGDDQCIQKGRICLFCCEEDEEESTTTICIYIYNINF